MNNRVAVAISGAGRSLKNLIQQQFSYKYEIAAVISSSPKAVGNSIAQDFDLPLLVGDFKTPISTEENDKLAAFLKEQNISWICLAGFLKPFPILRQYKSKIINIHPSLLPKFSGHGMYGMKVHRAVLDAQESHTGASIHFVNEKYDDGRMISQIKVDIRGISDAEKIAQKVFDAECELYPRTLDQLIKGNSFLNGPEIFIAEDL